MFKADANREAFFRRTTADSQTIKDFKSLAQKYVVKIDEWNRISPISLARQKTGLSSEFYLWSARNDKHGGFEGNKPLSQIITEKKGSVVWRPSETGGHCQDIAIPELANFLVQ
jgi:hypothetical protein